MSLEENQQPAAHYSSGTSPDMVTTSGGEDDPTTVEPGRQYSLVFDVHLRTADQEEVDFNKRLLCYPIL